MVNLVARIMKCAKKYVRRGGEHAHGANDKNHFEVKCFQKSVHMVSGNDKDSYSGLSDIEFVSCITATDHHHVNIFAVDAESSIFAEMELGPATIPVHIDCGANLISRRLMPQEELLPSTKVLRMWNLTNVIPVGESKVMLRNPKTHKKYRVNFVVVKEDLGTILGVKAARQMKIITINTDMFQQISHICEGEYDHARHRARM